MFTGLLAVQGADAATLRVPEDVATVPAAVDSAAPGDTVQIAAGTWTHKSTRVIYSLGDPFVVTACAFPRGGVTIRGAGKDQTTLDLGGTGLGLLEVINFIEKEGQGPLVIEDLALTGAQVGRAVVAARSDGVVVRRCRLTANDSNAPPDLTDGAAVDAVDCPLTLVDSEILDNGATYGIVRVFMSHIRIERCLFEGNRGTCVRVDQANGTFQEEFIGNQFVRNSGEGYGVGMALTELAGYTVRENLFLENVAEIDPGAAILVQGGIGEISFNSFVRDSCYASNNRGAGIAWLGTRGTVANNTFVGCHSQLGGAAFAAGFGGWVVFRSNLVTHSTGGAAVSNSNTVISDTGCNDFWANAAGNFENWTPVPSDITADPLFCDLDALDLTLRDGSPCADPANTTCPQIGAFGVGCGAVSVEPETWARIKSAFRPEGQ